MFSCKLGEIQHLHAQCTTVRRVVAACTACFLGDSTLQKACQHFDINDIYQCGSTGRQVHHMFTSCSRHQGSVHWLPADTASVLDHFMLLHPPLACLRRQLTRYPMDDLQAREHRRQLPHDRLSARKSDLAEHNLEIWLGTAHQTATC